MNKTPVLYVIARTDIDSMNPGKLAAQVAHAATVFERNMDKIVESKKTKDENYILNMYQDWCSATDQGYGTVIVLDGGRMEAIEDFLSRYSVSRNDVVCDIVVDPTYPVVDGLITHYIPLPTCALIFGYKEDSNIPFDLYK